MAKEQQITNKKTGEELWLSQSRIHNLRNSKGAIYAYGCVVSEIKRKRIVSETAKKTAK